MVASWKWVLFPRLSYLRVKLAKSILPSLSEIFQFSFSGLRWSIYVLYVVCSVLGKRTWDRSYLGWVIPVNTLVKFKTILWLNFTAFFSGFSLLKIYNKVTFGTNFQWFHDSCREKDGPYFVFFFFFLAQITLCCQTDSLMTLLNFAHHQHSYCPRHLLGRSNFFKENLYLVLCKCRPFFDCNRLLFM